jgi:hypothetical protein
MCSWFLPIFYHILSSKVCFPRDLTDRKPPEPAKFPGPTAGSTAGTTTPVTSPTHLRELIVTLWSHGQHPGPATSNKRPFNFIDIPSGYLT